MAAPNLPTLVPTAYSSYSGTAPTTTTVGNIDNTVAAPDAAYLVFGANSSGTVFYAFTDMPSDFVKMKTLTYNIRYKIETLSGDTEVLYIRVYKSDKTTALTDEMTVVTTTANISITNKGNTSFTGVSTTATKADWDGAFIAIKTAHSANKGSDGSVWSIDEVELGGTYDAPPTTALNSPANAATNQSLTPVLKWTGTDANSDTVEYNIEVFSSGLILEPYLLKYVDFKLYKWGSVSDGLYVELRQDSYTGTLLATSDTLNASSIVSLQRNRFTFSTPVELLKNTYYYFIIKRSGSRDVTNRYTIYFNLVDDYPSFKQSNSRNNGVWDSPANRNFVFSVISNLGTTLIYTTDAANNQYINGDGGSEECCAQQLILSDLTNSTPLISKLSSVPDAGFLDSPDEGDTHPFTSATEIQYTVQSALSYNTTYYWRVRAIDPTGSNTWGAWSDIRSFTTQSQAWTAKNLKAYISGAWTTKPLKVYSGGSWVTKSIKVQLLLLLLLSLGFVSEIENSDDVSEVEYEWVE